MVNMKATIDIPEDLYRQVKAKSALEGRAVREVAISLFRSWVATSDLAGTGVDHSPAKNTPLPPPPWFGSLRKYAPNARGRYDLETVRQSIVRGRTRKDKLS